MPSSPLLDQVRAAIRLRHLSLRTEQAYGLAIKRFILFHGKRHPSELGVPEIRAYLTFLAVDQQVAASTQNVALSALLFLYREVLQVDLPGIDGVQRAQRPTRLPVVFTRSEVKAVLAQLNGTTHLMASLLYGSGLRLLECLRLRVKDLDEDGYDIRTVQELLGHKDVKTTMIDAHVLNRGGRGVRSPLDDER
jgi:site-specific recombinase XerD